jgi:sec-independent protein translocase protein TatB
MFDIGWGEIFLIGVVALIVVGPKDLPALFRTIGNFTGKARAMAREFQRSLEQAANESGMSEVSKSLRSIDDTLNSATESARKFATQPMRQMVKTSEGDTAAKPHPVPTTPSTTPAGATAEPASANPESASPEPAGPAPGTPASAAPAPEPAAPAAGSEPAAASDETRTARG